ncbi:capsid protein [Lactobacillus reuteri]|uniref:putative minor capsid protein n=2 Tax=Limosilactobacillus reuteri TaxID=1598 RepID=UPI00146E2F8A|nr:putative minor capsid protein [Limosilactobacillus reuteri]NMV48491.1 capsid protein [Limosilactobacillus reuteri]NMV50196.1 capsid protein [Limosilactobacillus reuteri]NMV59781.1 capsid protein [Limosilactobacillus reuteri]NMV61364.1 capsid protein [Limosilactobacillus reuteri]NMV63341.1 capsid protein [Limosilactobacillus reuteri]
MLPHIPKKMCNQSISFQVPTGEEDDYGKRKTVEQVINNVLVQPQTIYSGSNNSRTITANAIVFLFAGISDPLPKITPDWVGTHLKFEERDYTITNIVDNREPYSNKVYSYELEVL